MKKIVVVVEEVEAARTALQWALHNLLSYGDLIILLHVFPVTKPSSSVNKKQNNHNSITNNRKRALRLKGFELALSFKGLCDSFLNAKVQIIVKEGDQDGITIAAMVREIDASALVAGLHDESFLYKMAMANTIINCRILAIKEPTVTKTNTTSILRNNSTNFDFSQIEITRLSVSPIRPPKIPYQILPSPFRIIWRSKR
ncbi:uncharacterized protein LOC113292879 [Papaver somniferum]|uniref:uncharacterized protein LOC113292879 n=1 Tax=Papaver somniferum TaxID=3469 RepID=UPI000E7032F0|nr:uncharacterized protein LOC113292879 [Papaver somniferum]